MGKCERIYEEKTTKPNMEENPEKKKIGIGSWASEHRGLLETIGLGGAAILSVALGLKNKDNIVRFCSLMREDITKGTMYSRKWFEKSSIEELYAARALVQADYLNNQLDMNYRDRCWDLLARFDNVIGEKQWAGQKYAYPVHSEHGWHLPSD